MSIKRKTQTDRESSKENLGFRSGVFYYTCNHEFQHIYVYLYSFAPLSPSLPPDALAQKYPYIIMTMTPTSNILSSCAPQSQSSAPCYSIHSTHPFSLLCSVLQFPGQFGRFVLRYGSRPGRQRASHK